VGGGGHGGASDACSLLRVREAMGGVGAVESSGESSGMSMVQVESSHVWVTRKVHLKSSLEKFALRVHMKSLHEEFT
jgi:hypothetical protein